MKYIINFMDKTLAEIITEATFDEMIKREIPVGKIPKNIIVGKIDGNAKVDIRGLYNRSTTLLIKGSEKIYNVPGTHNDVLLNKTNAALILREGCAVKGYATFDNEGNMESFFYDG